jgi:methionyl-tRNA formyltransferase
MAPLRVIFMGTAELACASLEALASAPDFTVAAVVTQPDRPRGRELKSHASPVKEVAVKRGLSVLQPERARAEAFIQQLRELAPEAIAVAAYGQILPKAILELPRFGCLNVHTSLLPKYRGAAPIQWAILNGESETGVTIMQMDEGLDTGPILRQEATPILSDDDAQTLHYRLAGMGAALLLPTLREVVAGKIVPRPQPAEGVSHARKLAKADGRLDWNLPARALWNRVRGLVPWPGAFAHLPASLQSQLVKIWKAEPIDERGMPGSVIRADHGGIMVGCEEGALRLLELQREGGRRMAAREFLAGHPLRAGDTMG